MMRLKEIKRNVTFIGLSVAYEMLLAGIVLAIVQGILKLIQTGNYHS